MNFLKSLWRKLFGVKTGAYQTILVDREALRIGSDLDKKKITDAVNKMLSSRSAYDPSEDPEKIMTGEVESYFD
jgi:hypothetical protein